MAKIEIGVLGAGGIEDYYAHLLRLDAHLCRTRFAKSIGDASVDGHCLELIGSQAILVCATIDGAMRASIEIIPDRTAREADCIFTAEPGFATPATERLLIARMIAEARRYHLCALTLHGFEDATLLARLAAQEGGEFLDGAPMLLNLAPAMAIKPAA